MKFLKFICALLIGVLSVGFVSCGNDDDEPKHEEVVDPTKPVADPLGTVSLSMHNESNGDTSLGHIGIGDDNNFYDNDTYYSQLYFADMGEMAGIGNITSIPMAGWAKKVQVKPGHGYVAYQRSYSTWNGETTYSDPTIYRIYVNDYITGGSGGIIGAEIKYQTPFEGADVPITVDKTSVKLTPENPSQKIAITNVSYVPFTIRVVGNIDVKPVYHSEAKFITTALLVSCPANIASDKDINATITLTTEGGKTTKINVTQDAAQSFLDGVSPKLYIDCEGLTEYLTSFSSNNSSEIQVSSNASWLHADYYIPNEQEWTNKILRVIASTNCSTADRVGTVTLKYGSITKTMEVTQYGFASVPEVMDVYEITSNRENDYRITPYGINVYYPDSPYMSLSDFKAEIECEGNWISFRGGANAYGWNFSFDIQANTSGKDREAKIKLIYPQNSIWFEDIVYKVFIIRQKRE